MGIAIGEEDVLRFSVAVRAPVALGVNRMGKLQVKLVLLQLRVPTAKSLAFGPVSAGVLTLYDRGCVPI